MLGIKKGMTQIFDEQGNLLGVTVVEVGPCQVSRVKTVESDGYNAIQLTLGKKKREFRVDNPADYQVGQELKADQFKAGEIVKVSGRSIGKGFAGTIKKYHHHRGPMSHGSKSHRIPGSIGSGTCPGRVWKGRGMPGRMGNVQRTVEGIKVVQVDAEKNLVLLHGSVPGKSGNLIAIRKS